MPRVTLSDGLTDFSRMLDGEVRQRGQSRGLQVRLISQYDGPMRQGRAPPGPASSALDGTEHAATGIWIYDAVRYRKQQAVQLEGQSRILWSADDRNLLCAKTQPHRYQMSEHRCRTPRQQHFRPGHARRTASGQDDGAQGESAIWKHSVMMPRSRLSASVVNRVPAFSVEFCWRTSQYCSTQIR